MEHETTCFNCGVRLDMGDRCILQYMSEITACGLAAPLPENSTDAGLVEFCSDECVLEHYTKKLKGE
jgi:hypothetical protein